MGTCGRYVNNGTISEHVLERFIRISIIAETAGYMVSYFISDGLSRILTSVAELLQNRAFQGVIPGTQNA